MQYFVENDLCTQDSVFYDDLLCVTVMVMRMRIQADTKMSLRIVGKKRGGWEVPFYLNGHINTERRRQVLYLRKPPVSASMPSGVIIWTASSIMFLRARASALLTALEMSP